jgi:hypothetical protein
MPSLAKTASKLRLNLLSRSRIRKREDEGCAISVSCGEVVFVDEAAEPVAALDGGG